MPNDQERYEIFRKFSEDYVFQSHARSTVQFAPGFDSVEFHPVATPHGITVAATLLNMYLGLIKPLIPSEDKPVEELFRRYIDSESPVPPELASERAMLVSSWGDYGLFLNRALQWHLYSHSRITSRIQVPPVEMGIGSERVVTRYIMDRGPFSEGQHMATTPSSVVHNIIMRDLNRSMSQILDERENRIKTWRSILELVERTESVVSNRFFH